jgi:hypothetical protein
LLSAVLLLAVIAPSVLAHGAVSVSVDPMTVTAGEEVTISVSGVEPDQDRVIVLIGQGIVVPFPTVRTDASGSFTAKLTIPSRLPGGTYRFEAIGDETLTGDVDVTAAAGGIAAQAPVDQAIPGSRTRSGAETAVLAALILIAGVGGLLLVLRAERFKAATGG